MTLLMTVIVSFVFTVMLNGSIDKELKDVPRKVCWNETIVENIGVSALYVSDEIITSGINPDDCKIIQVSNLSSVNCLKVKEVCEIR